MNFPTNPSPGQTFTNANGMAFVFNAQGGWKEVGGGAVSIAPQAALYGFGPPANQLGVDSDFYVDLNTGLLYGPRAGNVWPAASGKTVMSPAMMVSGNGLPGPGVGGNGNFYLDYVGGILYGPKAAGVWPTAPLALVYSATALATGIGVPGASTGTDGDYYVDLSTGLLYGPRAGGAWPSATGLNIFSATSLLTGVGAPPATLGVNGQYYLDTATGNMYGPKSAGLWPGTPSTSIFQTQALLTGAGVPANTIGNNGNYYVDRNSGSLYGPKVGGAWPAAINGISAPQSLLTGAGVPPATIGTNGSFYVDRNTGLLYGPMAAGAWPGSPVLLIPQTNFLAGTTNGVAPGAAVGSNGSYFLDLNSGLVWGPKAAGAWSGSPLVNGSRSPINDASVNISAAFTIYAYTSLTAPRVAQLPPANTVPAGWRVTVVDEAGQFSPTNTLLVKASGTDTVNGQASWALSNAYGSVTLESNGANAWTVLAAVTASITMSMQPQVRLSLGANAPFMGSSVIGANAIHAVPVYGNIVPLWDGTRFVPTAITDLAQLLSDSTNSPNAAAPASLYDVFLWFKAGVPTVSRGPAWASSVAGASSRGYSLQRVNGLLVNASPITNGPNAGAGLYIGTILVDTSGATCSWTLGGAATGGQAANVCVWNEYNRKTITAVVTDNGPSYIANAMTWRQARGSPQMQATFIMGLSEDSVTAEYDTSSQTPTGGATQQCAIGLNSTTAPGISSIGGNMCNLTGVSSFSINSRLGVPTVAPGMNYLAALEQTTGSSITISAIGNQTLRATFQA